ncbi:MAG: hypothetical protein PHQ96_01730 [Candidatus Omnitrophica bacterium]|nr:hypothetical protein [Candidatus Omnitrophota bacterium]
MHNSLQRPVIAAVIFLSTANFCFGNNSLKENFGTRQTLTFAISFNGIPSGNLHWRYLGQEVINGQNTDVLEVYSDSKIGRLLNLETKEKVYLDAHTRLPVKVMRDVVFFGRKEFIEEVYNQKEGYVKITRTGAAKKEEFLYQNYPIQNILALLYFFPQDIELKKGQTLVFNLPTSKVTVKFYSYRLTPKSKKEAFFLVGKGAHRFNLWLDKETKAPLRLEFITAAGKIAISPKNN